MRCLKSLLFPVIDSCFSWFTPTWRRRGREAAAALKRYINYNRHTLSADEQAEAEGLLNSLKQALSNWDRKETKRITELLEVKADAMIGFRRSPVIETVESIFVIMVIFLGVRTYYVQPFRIPTGSMQPSLNGIIVHPIDCLPAAPERWWNALVRGSSYVEAIADHRKRIVDIREHPKWLLFTETQLVFDDNSVVTVPSAQGAVIQYLRDQGKIVNNFGVTQCLPYRSGETIIRARVDAGDMVLVNRVAYHFRHLRRGETFVFDTRSINTDRQTSPKTMADQHGGTHYIKRLCGLPGDVLKVESPYLLVNEAPATEPTINRVQRGEYPYNPGGYRTLSHISNPTAAITDAKPLVLNKGDDPNLREYAALGDNTTNSLDSRYWGAVRQFNIIGPASFTLWPFAPHWGAIE